MYGGRLERDVDAGVDLPRAADRRRLPKNGEVSVPL